MVNNFLLLSVAMIFYIKTLGCKVNQAESDDVSKILTKNGHKNTQLPSEAHLIIINTCTVTHIADRKSRQMIRRLHEQNPTAEVIITGCVVENPQGILPEIGRIVKKQNILAEVSAYASLETAETTIITSKTRKHLLIQSGCNYYCSYCIIPTVRNLLTSKPANDVLKEAKQLITEGVKELVLTGINLGLYNSENTPLDNLVEQIIAIPGNFRVRLGSIEPNLISEKLLYLIENNSKICPHLHIPLQGGSDNLLKTMNRRYGKTFYLDLIKRIHALNKTVTITTDIIIGHPGETEEDFKEQLEFISQGFFLNIHLFMYSKRKGTVAYDRSNHLPETIKKQRMLSAINALNTAKQAYLATLTHKNCTVLIEETNNGNSYGYSEHYVYCQIPRIEQVNSFVPSKYTFDLSCTTADIVCL